MAWRGVTWHMTYIEIIVYGDIDDVMAWSSFLLLSATDALLFLSLLCKRKHMVVRRLVWPCKQW